MIRSSIIQYHSVNRHAISSFLFFINISRLFTGVGGDSSGEEGVLRCGGGPVPDHHGSHQCFSADISTGRCAGKTYMLLLSIERFDSMVLVLCLQ